MINVEVSNGEDRNNQVFRVIRIIDTNSIIINGGALDGLRNGSILEPSDSLGSPIIDPETNENLGYIDDDQVHIVVAKVYNRFSICKNNEYIESAMISALVTGLAANSTLYRKRAPLPVLWEDIQGLPKASEMRNIKIGDKFRLVSTPVDEIKKIGDGNED